MTFEPLPQLVVRTPVLPFDVLVQWTASDDRRAALVRLVEDPAIREAIYVASPELDAQIAGWLREPEAPASVAVERALVRYVSRMAGRSTPFGLFSAVAVGASGGDTRLDIPARCAAYRHTRLDNDFLFALCADLVRDPVVRRHLRYRASTSLYRAAGRLRYAEARLAGPVRAYHLVAVDRTEYLEALLARATAGATHDEFVGVLTADPEISRDEAAAFVDEVIDAQLLVAELAPAVTGREPTLGILDQLEVPALAHLAAPLRAAYDALAAIDVAPIGVAADRYRAIEKTLAAGLPSKVEPARLFQVDLFKPPTITLGDAVITELRDAIELLHRLAPTGTDPYQRFRERFTARYETREVPLVEVLDEEVGIGFGDDNGAASAPLLADLAFPVRSAPGSVPLGPRQLHLMSLVAHALRSGAAEIELTDEDIQRLSQKSPRRLPDTVSVGAVVVAESADAVAAGRYQLRVQHVGGGANLLGRFCHGSPEVAALAERALRAEEAHRPDAVFAEIVHLPEGRVGNVLLRPVLRGYEIPFLGASGADPDKQIAITDLLVSVVDNRVVLRSRRLGCEVIPRMTTAHNFTSRSLAVYRFLCTHAHQNVGGAFWSWGALADFPFLPRVRRGKLILDRARWLLGARDLAPLEAAFAGGNAAKTSDQIRAIRAKVATAVAELRKRLALPRWIVIADGDNELPVDLDNELMVESAAHLLKSRSAATLYELLPAPDQLAVRSPEGAFAHELVALFARAPEPRRRATTATQSAGATPRRFLPGSEWLYLKLYTGTATADTLLREHLAPAIDTALDRGLATRWFFLRYGDPDWHLRLRFTGDPRVLVAELLPFLHEALAPACANGLLWKLAMDTYEREVERYGGPDAIELAEQLFHADSEAALAIIRACEGDAGADAMWRITVRGIDQLCDDLGFTLADKLALAISARDAFGAEFGIDTAFQKRLGEKYRKHGKELAELLAAPRDPDHAYAPALDALAHRSRRIEPIGFRLRQLANEGRLEQSIAQLLQSYIHMHVNRMTRSSQRAHELVLYDLLRRHYEGQLARQRQQLDKPPDGRPAISSPAA